MVMDEAVRRYLHDINHVLFAEFGKQVTGNHDYLSALALYLGTELGDADSVPTDDEILKVIHTGLDAKRKMRLNLNSSSVTGDSGHKVVK